MKIISILFFVLLVKSVSFSQNKSVEKLKSLHTLRQKMIDRETVKRNQQSKSLYVNPFIGTGGHGHTYPGASAPFGMMQLSPDTRFDGWDGCSGYHYSDSIIYGFSHTHLSGTGVSDYADLLIVPQTGKPNLKPGYSDPTGYGASFSHKDEQASPGYYEVGLNGNDIHVRLTASERAGMHEYTFSNLKSKKYILIDLDHRDKVLNAALHLVDEQTVSGHRTSESWATEQHFFFYLQTSIAYKKAKLITQDGQHKLLLEFPKNTAKLLIRVGMSAVDEEGAKANLAKEAPFWDFNYVLSETVRKWNNELGKIDFYSQDDSIMTTFYTALYHAYLNPNVFNDVDGRYRGRDQKIHQLAKNQNNQYTVFSLWDTYRAAHPLFTLMQEKRTTDFIHTFLNQFDQGGDLPVWELSANETECMIGYHSVSVIADAMNKGIVGYDLLKAYRAMVQTAQFDEFGKKSFNDKGYIDLGEESESVSKTLEYAYDQFCINQARKELQQKGLLTNPIDSIDFYTNSFNFINAFDPSSKFMRARRGGLWYSPFDPCEVNSNYTEANSYQYSLYAPHAIGVLRDLLGGKDSLENWLDRLFTTESNLAGRHQVDITGLIGQYAHGNEPSHHMAYLYNYTNHPSKTQYYVDEILHTMYSTNPDGLSGNEDCGQMSAWYVLSALGIYQIAPGNPYYELGRPLMDKATMTFENGNILNITVRDNSKENKYIQSISLNGIILERFYLSHEELKAGGELSYSMGSEPNPQTESFTHAPTGTSISKEFIPLPYLEQENRVFTDTMMASLNYPRLEGKNFEIRYTLDGSEPTSSSLIYSKPIKVDKNTHLKSALYAFELQKLGESVEVNFIKRDSSIQLKLENQFSPQYAAGGQNALIDGIIGGKDYRTGDWQGYYGQDIVSLITFDEPRFLSEIGIHCLQDIKSWIFFPQRVIIETSLDGVNFNVVANTKPLIGPTEYGQFTQEFYTKVNQNQAIKSIRIQAVNFGKCPEWHLGAGNDTWLFSDEILLR
jgi:predicted alpha-1,2-mannosidase